MKKKAKNKSNSVISRLVLLIKLTKINKVIQGLSWRKELAKPRADPANDAKKDNKNPFILKLIKNHMKWNKFPVNFILRKSKSESLVPKLTLIYIRNTNKHNYKNKHKFSNSSLI